MQLKAVMLLGSGAPQEKEDDKNQQINSRPKTKLQTLIYFIQAD